MPDAYRKTLIRQIAACASVPKWWAYRPKALDHAGAFTQTRNPAKGAGRGRHGLYLYSAAGNPGVGRDELIDTRTQARPNIRASSTHPRTRGQTSAPSAGWWTVRQSRIAGATLPLRLRGPYARAMIQVCKEESFHHGRVSTSSARFAKARLRESNGTGFGQSLVVADVDDVPEPHDTDSQHTGQAMNWGIKRISNDDLRQKFVDVTVPQAQSWADVARPRRSSGTRARSVTISARSTGTSSGASLTATARAMPSACMTAFKAFRTALGSRRPPLRIRGEAGIAGFTQHNGWPQDHPQPDRHAIGWPAFEVFVRSKSGLDHKHVGSLHASDPQRAVTLALARCTAGRRRRGIWVPVPSGAIAAGAIPTQKSENFDPMAETRVYRRPRLS